MELDGNKYFKICDLCQGRRFHLHPRWNEYLTFRSECAELDRPCTIEEPDKSKLKPCDKCNGTGITLTGEGEDLKIFLKIIGVNHGN